MATNPSPTNHDGVFTVARHQYDLTSSAVKSWDFFRKPQRHCWDDTAATSRQGAPPLSNDFKWVWDVVTGCEYPVSDLVNEQYVGHEAAQSLGQVILFNYSRNQQPVALPLRAGQFF